MLFGCLLQIASWVCSARMGHWNIVHVSKKHLLYLPLLKLPNTPKLTRVCKALSILLLSLGSSLPP